MDGSDLSARRGHALERLAGGDPCSVDRCPRGCIHVHVGTLTMRVSREAFADLVAVVNQAAAALQGPLTQRPH
jgi:hypothetical protein